MQNHPARTQRGGSGGRLTVESLVDLPWNEWFFSWNMQYCLEVGRALHHAWGVLEYGDALGALKRLQQRVHRINEPAGRALAKGLEETLTVHGAGAYVALGRSLTTTRVITRLAQRLCGRLRQRSDWMPSGRHSAFMALDLMAMEAGMYRLGHAAYLPALREQLTGLNQPHSTRI